MIFAVVLDYRKSPISAKFGSKYREKVLARVNFDKTSTQTQGSKFLYNNFIILIIWRRWIWKRLYIWRRWRHLRLTIRRRRRIWRRLCKWRRLCTWLLLWKRIDIHVRTGRLILNKIRFRHDLITSRRFDLLCIYGMNLYYRLKSSIAQWLEAIVYSPFCCIIFQSNSNQALKIPEPKIVWIICCFLLIN